MASTLAETLEQALQSSPMLSSDFDVSVESLTKEYKAMKKSPAPPSTPRVRRVSADDVLLNKNSGPRSTRMQRRHSTESSIPSKISPMPSLSEVSIPTWEDDEVLKILTTPIPPLTRPSSSPVKRMKGARRSIDAALGAAALGSPPTPLDDDAMSVAASESAASAVSSSTLSLAELLPSPKKRPGLLTPLTAGGSSSSPSSSSVAMPFSPTKRLKVPPKPPTSELQARLSSSMTRQTALQTVLQLVKLHSAWRLSNDQNGTTSGSSHSKQPAVSFGQAVKSEFPSAKPSDIKAMLHFVETREASEQARKAKEAAKWSDEEKAQLKQLFRIVDADNSGKVSIDEFEELACMLDMGSRQSLREAYTAFANGQQQKQEGGGGGSASASASDEDEEDEMPLDKFLRLIETLDAPTLSNLRAKLPSMVGGNKENGGGSSSNNNMLIFDDGKQQIWRLVPGGRSLVKKAKRGVDGAGGSVFAAVVSATA